MSLYADDAAFYTRQIKVLSSVTRLDIVEEFTARQILQHDGFCGATDFTASRVRFYGVTNSSTRLYDEDPTV